MAIGEFSKRVAPNKHNTLNVLYAKAKAHIIRPTDATILLGGCPSIAVRRCLHNVVGKNGTIYGYEFSRKTWEKLQHNRQITNMKRLLTRQDRLDATVKCRFGDVTWAHSTQFEDIDLCTAWTKDKKTIAPRVADGTWVDYLRAGSSLNLLTTRLAMQARLPYVRKSFMGTISVWGGVSKEFTIKALSHMLSPLGWYLHSMDRKQDTYPVGTPLPGSESVVGSRTYHACTHKMLVRPYKQRSTMAPIAKELTLDVITYTDSSPMLTFLVNYRKED